MKLKLTVLLMLVICLSSFCQKESETNIIKDSFGKNTHNNTNFLEDKIETFQFIPKDFFNLNTYKQLLSKINL